MDGRTRIRILSSFIFLSVASTGAMAARGYIVGGIYMTAEQAAELDQAFMMVRICATETSPYAINMRNGDCLGGQSGTIEGN